MHLYNAYGDLSPKRCAAALAVRIAEPVGQREGDAGQVPASLSTSSNGNVLSHSQPACANERGSTLGFVLDRRYRFGRPREHGVVLVSDKKHLSRQHDWSDQDTTQHWQG
jgi:hypothetical protein